VFSCLDVRMKLFSEARFKWRQLKDGRPGKLFGGPELGLLERPWPNGTTGDLLARMEQDSSLAGNFYAVGEGDRVIRMRPDWVGIVLGSKYDDEALADLHTEIVGYVYYPGGPTSTLDPVPLLPEEVCHYAPIPDPCARYRGMSWLTPVIRELMADSAATTHKLKFFENGATPNLAVKMDPTLKKKDYNEWVDLFEERFGTATGQAHLHAYKTLYLGGGADVTVVGKDMQQIDFKVTQGAGETRIAAAAGTPPVLVGLSEGLQGSSLNEGNYAMARRRLADITMRPLWRNAAGSLETLLPPRPGAELWYDDRDISALQEDLKDAAEIMQMKAQAMKTLVDAGYTPDSARDAVAADDEGLLEHSGLVSAQLLPPGTASANSNGSASDGVPMKELASKVQQMVKEEA
jgi:phage portal protein BeeE